MWAMVKYDSGVLQEYVDQLYSKARWIALKCALGGAVIGGIAAIPLLRFMGNAAELDWVIFAGVGALIGFSIGRAKGFKYRLEAQTLLCQMQIECNTRKG